MRRDRFGRLGRPLRPPSAPGSRPGLAQPGKHPLGGFEVGQLLCELRSFRIYPSQLLSNPLPLHSDII